MKRDKFIRFICMFTDTVNGCNTFYKKLDIIGYNNLNVSINNKVHPIISLSLASDYIDAIEFIIPATRGYHDLLCKIYKDNAIKGTPFDISIESISLIPTTMSMEIYK